MESVSDCVLQGLHLSYHIGLGVESEVTSECSLMAVCKYAVDSATKVSSVDVSGCALSLVDDGLDTILDGREAACRIITAMSLNTGISQPAGRTCCNNDVRTEFNTGQDISAEWNATVEVYRVSEIKRIISGSNLVVTSLTLTRKKLTLYPLNRRRPLGRSGEINCPSCTENRISIL
jgi:hypothetical protein